MKWLKSFGGVESLLYQNSVAILKKKKNITPLKKTLLLTYCTTQSNVTSNVQ